MTKAISPGDSCFVNLIAVQVIHERVCDSICCSGYAVIVLKQLLFLALFTSFLLTDLLVLCRGCNVLASFFSFVEGKVSQ